MVRRPAAEFGLESLESRQLLAFVLWDGGGGDNSWHNPLNWSGDALPTAADHVMIDAPGTPTIEFSQGSATVASLWTLEALRVSGGALQVTGDWKQSAPLEVSGGWAGGPGNLQLNGTMLWTGGELGGTGKLQVLPGRTLTIAGDVALTGRHLVNNGSVVWASGNISADGAQILNLAGRTFLAQSEGSMLAVGAESTFTNRGILAKDGSAGSTTKIGITFNNTDGRYGSIIVTPFNYYWIFPWVPITPPNLEPGTVDVRGGTLEFTGTVIQKQGAVLNGGEWLVSSSTGRLLLPGANLESAWARISLSGAGAAFPQLETTSAVSELALENGRAFTFSNMTGAGRLTLSGPLVLGALSVSELVIAGGDVAFTGGLTVSRLDIQAGATLTLGGVSRFDNVDISGAGLLRITGETRWTSGTIAGPGQLVVAQGGTFRLGGTSPLFFNNGFKTLTRRLVNFGTIDWTEQNNGFGFGELAITGEVVNRGTFHMNGVGYLSTTAGTTLNQAPAFIHNFGTINSGSNLTLRGAGGGVRLINSGVVTVNSGRLVLSGRVLGGGTWNLAIGSELAFGGLSGGLAGATFNGSGTLRIATQMGWSSSNVTGQGLLIVTPAGRMKMAGNSVISRQVTNAGLIELGAAVSARFEGDLTNAGEVSLRTGQLQVAGNLSMDSSSVLRLSINSTSDRGTLTVFGHATVAGTLIAEFGWWQQPAPGVAIHFLSTGGHAGTFHTVGAAGLPFGRNVQFSFLGTMGQLTVVPI